MKIMLMKVCPVWGEHWDRTEATRVCMALRQYEHILAARPVTSDNVNWFVQIQCGEKMFNE